MLFSDFLTWNTILTSITIIGYINISNPNCWRISTKVLLSDNVKISKICFERLAKNNKMEIINHSLKNNISIKAGRFLLTNSVIINTINVFNPNGLVNKKSLKKNIKNISQKGM